VRWPLLPRAGVGRAATTVMADCMTVDGGAELVSGLNLWNGVVKRTCTLEKLANQRHHSGSGRTRIIWNHIPRRNCANFRYWNGGMRGLVSAPAHLAAVTRSQGGVRYCYCAAPWVTMTFSAALTSLYLSPRRRLSRISRRRASRRGAFYKHILLTGGHTPDGYLF
jgi:hypothetical protein